KTPPILRSSLTSKLLGCLSAGSGEVTRALPPACWLSAIRSHHPAAYVPDVAGRAVSPTEQYPAGCAWLVSPRRTVRKHSINTRRPGTSNSVRDVLRRTSVLWS